MPAWKIKFDHDFFKLLLLYNYKIALYFTTLLNSQTLKSLCIFKKIKRYDLSEESFI